MTTQKRNIRLATIQETGASLRQILELHCSEDGRYRWFGDDGSDSEVSGASVAEAIDRASRTWADWDFRLGAR